VAPFPRRATPGWPLLAVLGVHLLLAWSWRIAHPPAPDAGRERVIDLIPVPPPQPATPRLRPALPRPAAAASAPARSAAPAPKTSEPEAIATPAEAPARVADPFAVEAPNAPEQSSLGALVGKARREAGIIDRELRKGKSGVPEAADTPWARLQVAMEGAHRERGLSVTSETYTAPDGQVIYRFRRGGKVFCRGSGSVAPKIGGAVGGGEVLFDVQGGEGRAGTLVRCPSQAEFKRD